MTKAREHIRQANATTREIARVERAAEREVERLKKLRRRSLLQANRSGATYDELVAACGISDGLLGRELRTARSEAPARLAARPAHNPGDRNGAAHSRARTAAL